MRLILPCLLMVICGVLSGCLTSGDGRDQPDAAASEALKGRRPNILFCIADDWGWPHASAYGDRVVKTPAFDRVAREGILFQHAYISSPSCTPSRNAILTGQYHWRLDTGANLWSTLDEKTPVYPHLLADAGYHVGSWRKSYGPGKLDNWPKHPTVKVYKGFDAFLDARPAGQPFCFWFGASDPHRPYKEGSGKASGMDLSKVHLFPHYPDAEVVRSDIADYYWEVQRFDSDIAAAMAKLEAIGELDNTIVLITGDHGMPFPRCKGNLYDSGARVPLAVRWPAGMTGGRVVEDFVSTTDLAPTFLDLAGVKVPEVMTGRSLLPVLASSKSGRVDPARDKVFTGKERHTPGQEAPSMGGTPMRAMRTSNFLYIRNLDETRWPAGSPHYDKTTVQGAWLSDCDNGPTKTYIDAHKDKDDAHRRFYDLCFGRRPTEELYDLKKDPDQLVNVAADPAYANAKARMWAALEKTLRDTNDPRVIGGGEKFDTYPYYGGAPKHPDFGKKK